MLENLRKSTKMLAIKISLEEKMLENLVENVRKSYHTCELKTENRIETRKNIQNISLHFLTFSRILENLKIF